MRPIRFAKLFFTLRQVKENQVDHKRDVLSSHLGWNKQHMKNMSAGSNYRAVNPHLLVIIFDFSASDRVRLS